MCEFENEEGKVYRVVACDEYGRCSIDRELTNLISKMAAGGAATEDGGDFVKDVIFSFSKKTFRTTTVMFFADGTRVSARNMPGDIFDPEMGIIQCLAKKLLGSRAAVKRVVDEYTDRYYATRLSSK